MISQTIHPCCQPQGIIANETLAYFIGRTWLFFIKVGIDPARMRFRQHLLHEVRSPPASVRCAWRQGVHCTCASGCMGIN